MKLGTVCLAATLLGASGVAQAQAVLKPTFEMCQPQGSVKTERNGPQSRVTFRVDPSVRGAVTLFWVDHQGQLKPFGRLEPGQSLDINTYVGHLWVARDGGNCAYQEVQAGARSITFVVDAPPDSLPTPSLAQPEPRVPTPSLAQPERQAAAPQPAGRGGGKNDYGGYDIVGPHQAGERPYAEVRDWSVKAAWVGGAFAYCAADGQPGGQTVRIGYDKGQWQLAVPGRVAADWSGSLEVDGRRGSASGSAASGWAIVWLGLEELSWVRQGRQAILGLGRADIDFPLTGVAATITKIEECVERNGRPVAASTAAAPAPGGAAPFGAPPLAMAGPGPDELIADLFRRDHAGEDPLREANRERYLSRRLLRLLRDDEVQSRRRQEPGRLDFALLNGTQDAVEPTDFRIQPATINGDTATVAVQFYADKARTWLLRLRFELQLGDRGWRIVDIRYLTENEPPRSLVRTLGG